MHVWQREASAEAVDERLPCRIRAQDSAQAAGESRMRGLYG